MGDGGGSCLKFVAVKKWFHANSSSLGSSSESSWWNTQMQKEPVALCLRSGSWNSPSAARYCEIWGQANCLPHFSEISRSLGNEGNLEYPSSTFYGINVRMPSAFESWGICEDTLLCLAMSKKYALIKTASSFFFFFSPFKIAQCIKKGKIYAGSGLFVKL